ncbi:signal peptidase I [Halorientalis regularis]|uniref:Signal peptidase, endoplasmic reticulum-type n=1 Tax=Halorientalis regularis TaxID=660518 RepID=A0A1G7JTR9_9EURY|nr:signal peptidase I [Halorientalis regularis]SDF28318.1 signal peptidase, endoplasmic reticulum-type [Halorientalis regularis]
MSGLRERVTARTPSARQAGAVLGTLLVIALVVPFAVFAVPQVIGADHGFVILSGSMEPDIAPGDVVIVDASASVGVGDVITFSEDSDVPVTHRIVAEENGQWVTKGDANENRDTRPVSAENVLGKVVLTIPLIGHVVLWVNTPTGYIGLVLVPLLLLLGNELLSWARGRNGAADEGAGSANANDERDEGVDPDPAVVAESADGANGGTETEPMTHTMREEHERPVASTVAAESAESASVTVAVADLKLSLLASLALSVYAAVNVYAELQLAGAPDPISVGALTAGLLGLLFTGWVTGHAWYSARKTRQAAAAEPDDAGQADWPMPDTETDGGVESDTEAKR